MQFAGQGNGQDPAAKNHPLLAEVVSAEPRPSHHFVLTPQVQEVVQRALAYLRAGYPVNLAGPAGTGKTTLALHLATQLGQPVALIHGDEEFGPSDLVGSDRGYRRSKLVENCLTTACRRGHTLVYDEFTRGHPEANNTLLSILGEGHLTVHPNFRAIFTCNPQQSSGAYPSQDSLLERLITIHTDHYDRQTEIAITVSKSGIAAAHAARIVDVVRAIRRRNASGYRPSIRAAISIACLATQRCPECNLADPMFRAMCCDVLSVGPIGGKALTPEEIHAAIDEVAYAADMERVELR